MLTTEDFYDILAANERLLEENRRAQRLATETPRNAQLQERYLHQAAKLGLIPARFSSPGRPSPSVGRSPASSGGGASPAQRPLPPPGYAGGRPARERVARELARADSSTCNTAAAALAATEALYQGPPRHRFRSGSRATSSGSSDSESSNSSTSVTKSTVSSNSSSRSLAGSAGDGGGRRSGGGESVAIPLRFRDESEIPGGGGHPGGSHSGSPHRDRSGGRVAQQLARTRLREEASDGSGVRWGTRREGTSSGGRSSSGGARGSSGGARGSSGGGGSTIGSSGGGAGSRSGSLLREPTPSFLRRWRAARRRKHAKKQVVRFLLRASDEVGDVEGDGRGGQAKGRAASLPWEGFAGGNGSSGGGFGPGVVIAYPGSSVLFPPAALPYSLAEALEAVRQQAAHLRLGSDGGWEWGKERMTSAGPGSTNTPPLLPPPPQHPLTPPHRHPTRAADTNSPRREPAFPATAQTHYQHQHHQQTHHYQDHPHPHQHVVKHHQHHHHQQEVHQELQGRHQYTPLSLALSPSPLSPRPPSRPSPVELDVASSPARQYDTMHYQSPPGSQTQGWPPPPPLTGGSLAFVEDEESRGPAVQGWPSLSSSRHGRPPQPGQTTPPQHPLLLAHGGLPESHRQQLWEEEDYNDNDNHVDNLYDDLYVKHSLYGGGVAAPGTPRGFGGPVGVPPGESAVSGGDNGQQVGGGGGGAGPGAAAAMSLQAGSLPLRAAVSVSVPASLVVTASSPDRSSDGGAPQTHGDSTLASPSSPGLCGSEASFSPFGSLEPSSGASSRVGGVGVVPGLGGKGGVPAGGRAAAGPFGSGGSGTSTAPVSSPGGGEAGRGWSRPGPSPGGWVGEEAPAETGGVPGVGEAAEGQVAGYSLQTLRDQQSAIFRDVQALMQRLADMRGRLGT